MVLAAALAGVTVLIAAGLAWTARLVYIGNLDAHDLADKLSVPAPVSALDWPELHLNAVVAQPVVLLHVHWPAVVGSAREQRRENFSWWPARRRLRSG